MARRAGDGPRIGGGMGEVGRDGGKAWTRRRKGIEEAVAAIGNFGSLPASLRMISCPRLRKFRPPGEARLYSAGISRGGS